MCKYVIKNYVRSEIEVKKSIFITHLINVNNVKEAEYAIKKYSKSDARHNCYAYIIQDDVVVTRSSDDGEPQGTAGAPMLDVLKKRNLINVLVVVTRYFGGIKLGASNLLATYKTATLEAINKSELMLFDKGVKFKIKIEFSDISKIDNVLKSFNIIENDVSYEICVSKTLVARSIEYEKLKSELINATYGKVEIAFIEDGYFAFNNK